MKPTALIVPLSTLANQWLLAFRLTRPQKPSNMRLCDQFATRTCACVPVLLKLWILGANKLLCFLAVLNVIQRGVYQFGKQHSVAD